MIAYDYPILGLFWSMLMLFLWIAWIILVFRIIADIFRSDDMGGFHKAIWSIFVILIPWLGTLVYLIARGDGMARREVSDAQAQEAAVQNYIRNAAGSTGTADEIAKLSELRDKGAITDAEFQTQKARLLNA